eukprot:1151778-Pelagomonas_calceolata.AAC.3
MDGTGQKGHGWMCGCVRWGVKSVPSSEGLRACLLVRVKGVPSSGEGRVCLQGCQIVLSHAKPKVVEILVQQRGLLK